MREDHGILASGKFQITNAYDSHLPLIWEIINKIPHSCFVEFGCGYGSTPELQAHYDSDRNKLFVSYETNKEWADKFPRTIPIDDYSKIDFWSVPIILFIDCAPGEIRKDLVEKYADIAKVIIVHDTEPGAEYVYHIADALSKFKYRKDYMPEGLPFTTAVSNFVEL